jgi:hypothetical protein
LDCGERKVISFKSPVVLIFNLQNNAMKKCLVGLFMILSICLSVKADDHLAKPILTGAEQTQLYLPLLKGKRIAILANPTSVIGKIHLVDSLQKLGVNIVKVFGPEHGFRGNASAGVVVSDEIDVEDIALVAATVLTEDKHEGKTYTITGPELLSYTEAAEQLSEVLRKPIHYPAPTPELFTQVLKEAGTPSFIASYMIPVYSLIADGKVAILSDDVERLTGKKPTPLKKVLERDFG